MKNHNLAQRFSNLSESTLYDSQNLEEEYIFSFPAFSCITLITKLDQSVKCKQVVSKISQTRITNKKMLSLAV
jgi:hypothetical protein